MDAEDAAEPSDEEDNAALIDVSEETREPLTISCTWSVPNETRKRTRSKYPLTKVVATKTSAVDLFLRSEISQATKFLDKDLAKCRLLFWMPSLPSLPLWRMETG